MHAYKLSPLAQEDLKNIFEFDMDRFRVHQVIEYLTGLEGELHKLAKSPFQYPAVDHLHERYRRGIYPGHSICFWINGDINEIMWVLYMEDTASTL